MARSQINLNRFRKIYPQFRKSPVWWTRNENGADESVILDVSQGIGVLTFQTLEHFNSPIVIATPADGANVGEGNINVWVANLSDNDLDGIWDIEIGISDSTYQGLIHIHIFEGNPT